jgi:type IV secretion system protein VirB10
MNLFPFRQDRVGKEDAEEVNTVEGERDAAVADRGLRLQNKATNLVIVASVVTVAGLALWRYYAAVYDRHKEATEPAREVVAAAPSLPPLKPPTFSDVKQDQSLPPLTPSAGQATATAGPTAVMSTAPAGPPTLTPAQQLIKRRLESPLVFKVAETQVARAAGADTAGSPAASGTGTSTGDNRPARVGQQARATGARAYMLADPSMMITQVTRPGRVVLLERGTRWVGQQTCMQTEDVRSADGRVVLLERGTRWVGQQANGVAQGQRRVGIVWSRGETPNHVLVDVESGGADWLGRPGIAGEVDSHFWDRFGAAILLSVISDAGPYLTALRQGGGSNNTTIAFPNITGGAQQVMSDVLKSTMNIQPTLTAPQASQVVIHVARDLDFRDVYALQERTTVTR